MLDTLNDSPDSFEKAIAKICIIFVILAAINVFSGFLQVYRHVCFPIFLLFILHPLRSGAGLWLVRDRHKSSARST
jgi:hypothetical protein